MNQSKDDNRRKIMDSLIRYFGNTELNSTLQEVADDILKSIEPKEEKDLEEAANALANEAGYPQSDKTHFETTYWRLHNVFVEGFKEGAKWHIQKAISFCDEKINKYFVLGKESAEHDPRLCKLVCNAYEDMKVFLQSLNKHSYEKL